MFVGLWNLAVCKISLGLEIWSDGVVSVHKLWCSKPWGLRVRVFVLALRLRFRVGGAVLEAQGFMLRALELSVFRGARMQCGTAGCSHLALCSVTGGHLGFRTAADPTQAKTSRELSAYRMQ